jgi:hypothetical protein
MSAYMYFLRIYKARNFFICRIILPRVTYMVVPYFFTLSYKCHDFREKVTEHKTNFSFISTTLTKHF